MGTVNKDMVDKLLNNLVFEPMDIKYRIFEQEVQSIYDSPFKIVLFFDPERYHTEGKNFTEEYSTYVYEIEDHIDSALKYLGTSGDIIDSIIYRPSSEDLYKRVEDKINDAIPKVKNEFKELTGKNLPEFDGIFISYNYHENIVRDYIDFYFKPSDEIPDFQDNTKYLIMFHRILGKYVNLDSFVNNIITETAGL